MEGSKTRGGVRVRGAGVFTSATLCGGMLLLCTNTVLHVSSSSADLSAYRGNLHRSCLSRSTSLPLPTPAMGARHSMNPISEQQTAHPDGFLITTGDFNHTDFIAQTTSTCGLSNRGDNLLDLYSIYKGAYKAFSLPHLCLSDHITIMLRPASRLEGTSHALMDCFSTILWDAFKRAAIYNVCSTDIEEYTEAVTAYIAKCTDDVTHCKTITVGANQKPWLTGKVHRLLRTRDTAFRTGHTAGPKHPKSVQQENIQSLQQHQRCTVSLTWHPNSQKLQPSSTAL